jgi:hypothetical protein
MKIALTILTESPLRKTGLTSLFHEFLSRGLTRSGTCETASRQSPYVTCSAASDFAMGLRLLSGGLRTMNGFSQRGEMMF